jgi:anti-sigma factor RsiW
MDCARAKDAIHGYVDGELEPAARLEVEQHLKGCAACEDLHQSVRDLQAEMRAGDLRERAPAGLAERVRGALASDPGGAAGGAAGAAVAGASAPAAGARRGELRRLVPWALSFAAGALLTMGIQQFGGAARENDARLSEIVDAHVRSLLLEHTTDVASSDRHTVKPWFAGKLDFSPWADDLAAQGFPLAGARLDYLWGQPAAAIVYHSNRHVINLFIRRATPGDATAPVPAARRGYHVVEWRAGDFAYAAISDVNDVELDRFVGFVKAASR